MIIHSYYSSGGKDLILSYILSLDKAEKIDGLSVLQDLEKGNFDRLLIKPWIGNIREVYFYKHNRIFFIIKKEEHIYLLHACKKQKNKTEKLDREIVLKRAAEIEQAQK